MVLIHKCQNPSQFKFLNNFHFVYSNHNSWIFCNNGFYAIHLSHLFDSKKYDNMLIFQIM